MSNSAYAKAVRKYAQFHRFDPDVVTDTDFEVPAQMRIAGAAKNVRYASPKIDPTTLKFPRLGVQGYAHDHDAGVNAYLPLSTKGAKQAVVDVPPFIRQATALVQLGHCLGFDYAAQVVNYGTYPQNMTRCPGLFTTDCGHALLIIDKFQRLQAIMWGGSLRVEARGIVG